MIDRAHLVKIAWHDGSGKLQTKGTGIPGGIRLLGTEIGHSQVTGHRRFKRALSLPSWCISSIPGKARDCVDTLRALYYRGAGHKRVESGLLPRTEGNHVLQLHREI